MNQLKKKSSKIVTRALACLMAVAMVVTSLAISPKSAEAAKVTVKSVKVTSPATKTLVLKKGKKYTLKTKVTVKPNKAANKKVTFKSSNKKVATVTSKGVIKAKKNGKATITVTSKTNKKKKTTVKVIVGTPVTKVALNKKTASVKVGATVTLKATVSPKKPSVGGVTYTTSNKNKATVSTKGVVKGVAAGTVTITATAKDGSKKKATCKVTVTAAASAGTPKPAATAIPEPKDTREAVMVEDFQDDAVGDYLNFTYAGRSLAETGAKMEIVKDPANANNKLVKITIANKDTKYCGYDFAPVVSVSLGAIKACEGTTLDDYEAIRFKTRVVSDSEHTYKAAVAYFAPYKTITSKYSFSTYDDTYGKYTADDQKEDPTHVAGTYKKDTVEKRILAQFTNVNCMARSKWTGIDPDDATKLVDDNNDVYNKYMPEMHESIPSDYGYSEDDHKIALANRTLQFNKDKMWYDTDGDDTTNDVDLTTLDAFDVALGSTYPETKDPETTTWYLDDVQLIKKASSDIKMTDITLNVTEKAMEVEEEFTLAATKAPANTTDSVLFSSSNKDIATVNGSGLVKAVSEGSVVITASAKKSPSVKATCAVTVSAKSATKVVEQTPATTDSKYTDNVTAGDTGVVIDCTGSNNYGQFSMVPSADVLADFAKCKKVKFTFKLSDIDVADTDVKLTVALVHKNAKSTYDTDMTSPSNGRIKEYYLDITPKKATQNTGIKYDSATDTYTAEVDFAGVSGLDNVGCIMIARNGYNNEGTHFKVALSKVEYTVKTTDEKDADKLDGLAAFTYPMTETFAATPFAFGWSNWVEATSNYKALTDVEGVTVTTGAALNYVGVPGKDYDGISIPLDNRTGVTGQAFYVEATVRSLTGEKEYGKVGFAGSNTVDGSIYYPASAMKQYGNDYYLQRTINAEWQTIKLKVEVPSKELFGEIRLKGTGSNGFEVSSIKVEKYVAQDLTMVDEPVAPITRSPFGSSIQADMSQEFGGYGYTKAVTDGGFAISFTQQYGEFKVSFSQPVSATLTSKIIASMTADKNVAIKVYDTDGTALATSWNNKSEKTFSGINTTADYAGKKIAGLGFMSQETGDTVMTFTGAHTADLDVVSADMTQEFGGYGYTKTVTDAGISVEFTQQYGEFKLVLPEKFNAEDVKSLLVKLTSDKNVAIKLYDGDGTALSTSWNNKTDKNFDVATTCAGKIIASIGIMSQDTGNTAMVISGVDVTAQTELKADMAQEFGGYGYTKAATEGGIAFSFTQQYGEVKFALANTMTADEIASILVSMTANQNVCIKLYDEAGTQLAASWNNTVAKTFDAAAIEKLGLTSKIASIGLMSQATGDTVCVLSGVTVTKDCVE